MEKERIELRKRFFVRVYRNSAGESCYVANGPDGHLDLLMRLTCEAAIRDGLEYFERTREYKAGRWVLRGCENGTDSY